MASCNIDSTIQRLYHDLIDKREKQTASNTKCDKYKHMCVIIDKNGEILISGYNIFKTNSSETVHAEAMALQRLYSKYGRPKRRFTVDILVIRTNGGNSKPCVNCLKQMENYSHIINIKNIYYSHEDEITGIRKDKFSALLKSDDKHVSSYYRHKMRKQGKLLNVPTTDSSSSSGDSDSD